MKLKGLRFWAGVCVAMAASQAEAALIGLATPVNNPYYADFALAGLSFTETYDSGSQTATLSVTTRGNQTERYTSSSQSPGTHGSATLGPNHDNRFVGSFSLTALIRYDDGNWTLESGSFAVYGNLRGGIGHHGDFLLNGRNRDEDDLFLPGRNRQLGELLLHGNLVPGTSGPNGTFGYRTSETDPRRFEFLYTVETTQNIPANGKNIILQDWATVNPFGTTVQGAMILDVRSCGWNWTGDWSQPWAPGSAHGYGNAFVPESSAYGWLAAGLAALAVIAVGRKTTRRAGANDV